MKWDPKKLGELTDELIKTQNERESLWFQIFVAKGLPAFVVLWFLAAGSQFFALWLYAHDAKMGHVVFARAVLPVVVYILLTLSFEACYEWGFFTKEKNDFPSDPQMAIIFFLMPASYLLVRDLLFLASGAVFGQMLFNMENRVTQENFWVWWFVAVTAITIFVELVAIVRWGFAVVEKPVHVRVTRLMGREQELQQQIAQIHAAKRRWDLRVKELRDRKPDTPIAFAERGRDFLEAGLLDEALVNVDAAIVMDPDCAEAHLWRGMVLAAQEKEAPKKT